MIKELRELTGAGMMEIKHALDGSRQQQNKAVEILRKKGALKVGKKADRVANEGLVEAYIHPGNRMGVLLEVNCETDFVARTADFKNLVKEIALHIAGGKPALRKYCGRSGRSYGKRKGNLQRADKRQAAEDVLNKIVEGKMAKYYEEACLMEQPFAKNPDIKIKDLIAEAVAKIGENIQIKRFARFVLGN